MALLSTAAAPANPKLGAATGTGAGTAASADANVLLQHHNPPVPLSITHSASAGIPMSMSMSMSMQMPLPPPPMPVSMSMSLPMNMPPMHGNGHNHNNDRMNRMNYVNHVNHVNHMNQSPTTRGIASPPRAFRSAPPDIALSRSALGRPINSPNMNNNMNNNMTMHGTPPHGQRGARTNNSAGGTGTGVSGVSSLPITRKRTNSPRTVARRAPHNVPGGVAGVSGVSGVSGGTGSTAADAVLPRGSVVRITGNNRTKRELLNRQGLVLSAQTLGGWHEVALDDGATVRVQRNALTLLNAPSPATVARLPPATSSVGNEKKTRNENGNNGNTMTASSSTTTTVVDIGRMGDDSLRKYKIFHKLGVPESAPRSELVNAVKKHFSKTKVNENEVIRAFLRFIHQVKARSENHQHDNMDDAELRAANGPTMSTLTNINIPNTSISRAAPPHS